MTQLRRFASSLLLAVGLVLVFGGLSNSLGFSVGGMAASLAAIAALLYSGAVWFGAPPPVAFPAGADTVVVFDHRLRVAAGAGQGTSLLTLFPDPIHAKIAEHCHVALRGEHTHFLCEHGGHRLAFDASPVPSATGAVHYGVLVCRTGARIAAVAGPVLSTV